MSLNLIWELNMLQESYRNQFYFNFWLFSGEFYVGLFFPGNFYLLL